MEDFFVQCVQVYLELTGLREEQLRHVKTPFLVEDQHSSPQRAPSAPGEPYVSCPFCSHTWPQKEANAKAQTSKIPDSAGKWQAGKWVKTVIVDDGE